MPESVERVILSIECDDVFRHANGKHGATRKLLSAFTKRADARETSRVRVANSREHQGGWAGHDDASSLTAANGQGDEDGLECGVGLAETSGGFT